VIDHNANLTPLHRKIDLTSRNFIPALIDNADRLPLPVGEGWGEGQTVIFATDFDKNDEVTTPTLAERDEYPFPLRRLCPSAVHARHIKSQPTVLYQFIMIGTFCV
jgi:hypothetical protein